MVGLLYIAARAKCEAALGELVTEQLLTGTVPSLSALKQRWGITEDAPHPIINVTQHTLESYNLLIPQDMEVSHASH